MIQHSHLRNNQPLFIFRNIFYTTKAKCNIIYDTHFKSNSKFHQTLSLVCNSYINCSYLCIQSVILLPTHACSGLEWWNCRRAPLFIYFFYQCWCCQWWWKHTCLYPFKIDCYRCHPISILSPIIAFTTTITRSYTIAKKLMLIYRYHESINRVISCFKHVSPFSKTISYVWNS